MKRIIITIFLISLVTTKEFVDINTKIKNVIQNRKDGNKLTSWKIDNQLNKS